MAFSTIIDRNELTELACLLIPVEGKNLILPNVSVAEIVGYLFPVAEDDTPEWFLGMVNWRGQEVPLVSFDALNGQTVPDFLVANRLAIINTTGIDDKLLWIGIVTQYTPRLMRVGAQEINELEGEELAPMEVMAVTVNGEEAVVPNIDLLQQKYLQFRKGQPK